ncbi:hypothetical protein ACFX1R_007829 [Malus domestica]
MPAEKMPKTSSAAREGPPVADRLVIDLTSSIGKKDGVARSEPVMSAMPRWLIRLLIGLLSVRVLSCLQCRYLCQNVRQEQSLVLL